MTTKAQERKALEQIRKIVEGLGEDSYIGMAFEGCFEIAEENIENDFGCSMKQKWESAEKKVANLMDERRSAELFLSEKMDEIEKLERSYNEMIEAKNTWKNDWLKLRDEKKEQDAKVESLEAEIIKLKAKLYDMMTA